MQERIVAAMEKQKTRLSSFKHNMHRLSFENDSFFV